MSNQCFAVESCPRMLLFVPESGTSLVQPGLSSGRWKQAYLRDGASLVCSFDFRVSRSVTESVIGSYVKETVCGRSHLGMLPRTMYWVASVADRVFGVHLLEILHEILTDSLNHSVTEAIPVFAGDVGCYCVS